MKTRIDWAALGRLAVVSLQFLLIGLLAFVFTIENWAVLRTLALAHAGFLVHHFLPERFRLRFFVGLSLAGIVFVLGPVNAAWLVGTGVGLIGLAHAPLAFRTRLGLIAVAGALLVGLRAGWLPGPWPAAIWPVFGSMFMFRLLVYLYDVRAGGVPLGPARALAYFFMLPNVCFPLYPVVDYKTFCLTYHNDERFKIYQTGIDWMLRGVVQLLLYRFVYQHLVDPAAVADLGRFALCAVGTYLLYLRISGSFHLIVGMLHLFGFNLSETHHRYLLSASFTDFWQRINIYWKDFMMKLFFYPAYFKLKGRMSGQAALIASTVFVFAVTWMLHSYQWFWLRGQFPVTWQDGAFWAVLAVLVVAQMLRDQRHSRHKRLRPRAHTWRSGTAVAWRTACTFAAVVVLWSMWTSGSFAEWTATLRGGLNVTPGALGLVLSALVLIGLAGVAFGRSSSERTEAGAADTTGAIFPFWRRAATGLATVALLLWLGLQPGLLAFAPHLVDTIDHLKKAQLNERDTQLMERGYYENLTDLTRASPELYQLYMKRVWPLIYELPEVRHIDDILELELPASTTFQFKGQPMRTNRFGFHDREYEQVPLPGTYRFVLVGASMSFGGGIPDEATFENLVEDRLNRESAGSPRYEILNLSIGGYGPLQKLRMLEVKGFDFAPQALLYDGHSDELGWMVSGLQRQLGKGHQIPWDFPREVARKAGLEATTGNTMAEIRLRPHAKELLVWTYTRIVEECRERGIRPYFMYVPRVTESHDSDPDKGRRVMALARDAGFTVLDLSQAYAGAPVREALVLVPWDWHPSAEGHRLLAEALYGKLVEQGFPRAIVTPEPPR